MCRRVKGGLDNAMGVSWKGWEKDPHYLEWYLPVNPLNGNKVITDMISLQHILGKIPSESNFQEYGRITT